jgi:membrane protein required for colicin V production
VQVLDWIFLALVALLVLRGFLKGFTGEFFSIASLALALIASAFLFKNGAAFLRARYLQMALLPEILSFVIIFLVVFIAGKIIERIVTDIIDRLNLETLDKVLGIVLGLAEGVALVVLAIFVLHIQPLFNAKPLLETSLFVRVFLPFIGAFRV